MTHADVLIVDDDPDMLETMQLVLGSNGLRCRTASNGVEALEQVAAARPDVVVLDMPMPVMNGWETARALRQRFGHTVPIIVVTASEHARERAAEVGADDVLSKPFDIDELRQLVARYAGHGRGQATG